MKKFPTMFAVSLVALLPVSAAFAATTITGITASPAQAKTGEPVSITVTGSLESANCGVRMEYNSPEHPKEEFVLSEKGGLPFTLTKTFNQPGTYTLQALGRKVGKFVFGCEGNASTTVTVAAAGKAAAMPAMSAACPEGWEMVAGQKDPSKGFTCGPKKPAAKIECGPKLRYFEKDGLIGCKK